MDIEALTLTPLPLMLADDDGVDACRLVTGDPTPSVPQEIDSEFVVAAAADA